MKIRKDRYVEHLLSSRFVFVIKNNSGILNNEYAEYLKKTFLESLETIGGELLNFRWEKHYIVFSIQYPPRWSITKIVNALKGRSSRLIRRDMVSIKEKLSNNANGIWDRKYFAESISPESPNETDRLWDYITMLEFNHCKKLKPNNNI